jgi:hypothetical protein
MGSLEGVGEKPERSRALFHTHCHFLGHIFLHSTGDVGSGYPVNG